MRIFGPAHVGDDAKGAILPAGAKRFLMARLLEGAGVGLLLLVAALAAALFTYVPTDPSLNNASDAETANLLGPAGALVADLLIQGLGIAAVQFPVYMPRWTIEEAIDKIAPLAMDTARAISGSLHRGT